MDEPVRVICVDEGRWVGPQITCSPRSCGHPGEIANGVRNGSAFTYHERVSYSCLRGYQLVGRPYRVCQANGRWSGKLPTCRRIACRKLMSLRHGRVMNEDAIPRFGSKVSFTCDTGYKLTGAATRTCLRNGTWSGQPAACTRMNCGHPGAFPNGDLFFRSAENTTVGSYIEFKCKEGMLLEGNFEYTECLPNGSWSHPMPKCWSPCTLLPVANGSIVVPDGIRPGRKVKHGSILQYDCHHGFYPGTSTTTCCHNGTWLTTPECTPAPCERRPRDIKNGIVRYHRQRHGARALYECDFGFNLVGDNYLVCQYGNWIHPSKVRPVCEPNTCDYPGNITHGRVLLVGHIGKYEYRQYVQPVGHNDKIEYQCHKHYQLVGPSGSTCVNGTWSPSELPACQPKHHPHLYYLYPTNRSFFGQLRRASVSPFPPTDIV